MAVNNYTTTVNSSDLYSSTTTGSGQTFTASGLAGQIYSSGSSVSTQDIVERLDKMEKLLQWLCKSKIELDKLKQ